MVERLYLDDAYCKEFEATVEEVNDGTYVVLDRTAFYPRGGGQPHDTGTLVRERDGEEFDVVFTGEFDDVSHEVEQTGLQEGDTVTGRIDWNRRYTLMQMHTAAHVVSALLHDRLDGEITGNQKGTDETRIDVGMDAYRPDVLKQIVRDADAIVQEGHPVTVEYMPRDEALERDDMVKLADRMPPDVDPLRIVHVGDVDTQADGGTHVSNTEEISGVEPTRAKNKGSSNRRVYFTLR